MSKIIESGCGNVTTLAGDEIPSQINVSEAAKSKIKEICEGESENSFLRVAIAGGGCAGLQYMFGFDDEIDDGDIINEWNGGRVVVDDMSIEYMKGATVDYVSDFGGEYFTVVNPHASSQCGCGSSFSPEGFQL